jgi:putative hydrolase of the HAD superfamily
MPVRNVIFDFGGVLVRWHPQEIINGFYRDESLREALRTLVFQHPDWIEMDRGSLEEDEAAQRFAARLGRPQEEMLALLQHVKDSLIPIEESFAIASDLQKRGIPLYGLSNMPAATFAHLRERYDHWQVFRGIVISGEIRLMKPDRAIFDHISQRYGLLPSETVFIDDNPPNIEAARELGYSTILFENPQQCARELDTLLTAAKCT